MLNTIKNRIDSLPVPAVLALLMIAGAFVRLYGLGVWDYYHDEIWHVYVAGQPTPADVFYTNLRIDGHPILPYLLWHYLLLLWDDPWMARLPSLVAGILCIPAGYLLGREMFRTKGGALFGAFFMTFSGLMIEQSDVVRGYILMMLFAILGLWTAFRYRHQPQSQYLLFYAAFMALALLCEFAAAPVTAFAALLLLWGIYKKPGAKLPALAGWVAIHTALLVYLLWMVYMLQHVGGIHIGHFFIHGHAKPFALLESYISYFLQALYDSGFLSWISQASGSTTFFSLAFVAFFCIAAMGFVWLCRRRKWELLFLIATLSIITLGFLYFNIVPMQHSRRNMALSIAVMVIFYGGFCYIMQYGWKRSLSLSPETWTLIATACLCAGYAVYGGHWRMFRPWEFQQTLNDRANFFAFLDAHAGKHDIIITDTSTYYHFWNREHNHCQGYAKPLSAIVAYYPCYRLPLYAIQNDIRMDPFVFNLADFQRALQELDRMHRLKDVKNIWIVGLQFVGVKTTLLNPHFSYNLLHLLSPAEKKRYRQRIDTLINQQGAFAHYAYAHASSIDIANIYPCSSKRNQVNFTDADDCIMKIIMLALPKTELERKVINHARFSNPAAFLEELQQVRNKQIF